jgi:hypothetical protein
MTLPLLAHDASHPALPLPPSAASGSARGVSTEAPVRPRLRQLTTGPIMVSLSHVYDEPSTPQKRVALQDVDLTVRQGEIVFVMGPKDSGKTALLELVRSVTTVALRTFVLCNLTGLLGGEGVPFVSCAVSLLI